MNVQLISISDPIIALLDSVSRSHPEGCGIDTTGGECTCGLTTDSILLLDMIGSLEAEKKRLDVLEELRKQQGRMKMYVDGVWIWHIGAPGYQEYPTLAEAADAEIERREKENG